MISEKIVGRLSLYRRLLRQCAADGMDNIYSYQLAVLSHGTAPQVRRDLMEIGYSGSPNRGYGVKDLIRSIGAVLDAPVTQKGVLVGVGNMGRALLSYFASRTRNILLVAAFDRDSEKTGRVIQGCRCHPVDDMKSFLAREAIQLGVIAVPAAEAQSVAERLAEGGVRGVLNLAPVPLDLPADVYVETLDMTMYLEKIAYFARMRTKRVRQSPVSDVLEERDVTALR